MPQSVAKGASMSTTIQFLHASHGDCIFLRHEQEGKIFNLLIDGGPGETFGQLNGYAKLRSGLQGPTFASKMWKTYTGPSP